MKMVWLTALGVGGATVFGALIGFAFKHISHKFSDIVLSFAAGVMLSAAVIGLILPSVEYGGKYGIIITVIGIFFVTKAVAGNSAKFFIGQQKSLGAVNGYVEEMIHGQKVIKVFCHEEEAKEELKKYQEIVNLELEKYIKKDETYSSNFLIAFDIAILPYS